MGKNCECFGIFGGDGFDGGGGDWNGYDWWWMIRIGLGEWFLDDGGWWDWVNDFWMMVDDGIVDWMMGTTRTTKTKKNLKQLN